MATRAEREIIARDKYNCPRCHAIAGTVCRNQGGNNLRGRRSIGTPRKPMKNVHIERLGRVTPRDIQNAIQGAHTGTLTDDLIALAREHSEPVACACGASWGPSDALRIIERNLAP